MKEKMTFENFDLRIGMILKLTKQETEKLYESFDSNVDIERYFMELEDYHGV